MQFLIVAATQPEIAPLINKKLPLDFLITGVGVPATLYLLQKKLREKRYDFVIQAGIAGTFTNKLSLGDVVLVEKDCFADIGINEKGKFTSIFETTLADGNEFPYKKGWLVNPKLKKEKTLLQSIKAITINTISDNAEQKKMMVQQYHADIESMEGAAFHYVCLRENISFLQIRSISNHVGERDKNKWKIKGAIKNLNIELFRFLQTKK